MKQVVNVDTGTRFLSVLFVCLTVLCLSGRLGCLAEDVPVWLEVTP